MIEAFPPDRANQPFHVSVLPRRMRSRQYILDIHSSNGLSECSPVAAVSVADQKSWGFVERKGFTHLLGRPFRSGMGRNIEVRDAPSMMLQHYEYKQESEVQGGNQEEIHRDELFGVVLQESPPRLRRWLAVSDHVVGDRGFRNLNSEFQQLSMNPRRSPERICQTHLTDQIPSFLGNDRSANTLSSTLPSPVQPKSPPMPADHGLRLDDQQHRPPIGPNFGEPNPDNSISSVELNPTPLASAQDIQ